MQTTEKYAGGTRIHPTAIVDKKALLGTDVEIGPYSVIGPDVKIGDQTRIDSHVIIGGDTTIGCRNEIFSGACLGGPAQVRNYRQIGQTRLVIGDENVLREYVTVNAASKMESATRIGNRNFLMIQVHIGHDCVLGDDIYLANAAGVSGHVTIGDRVVIGGLAGVHQFVHIGKLAMVGGISRVTVDVPPYSMCSGSEMRLYGVNSIGLRRAGMSAAAVSAIRKAFHVMFMRGLRLVEAIAQIRRDFGDFPELEELVQFCEASKRGVCRPLFRGVSRQKTFNTEIG